MKQNKALPFKAARAVNDKRRKIQCKKDEDENRVILNGIIILEIYFGLDFFIFLKKSSNTIKRSHEKLIN